MVEDQPVEFVTFGDSLTDGYQSHVQQVQAPQDTATIDLNERYPDYLKRRLDAAGRAVFVSNAGITGNRVAADGQIPAYGPQALTRVSPDLLAQAGVTDVILWEGVNDVTQTSGLTAQQLAVALEGLIGTMHVHGLRVVQATLTPANLSGEQESLRQAVNAWIRASSPADSVLDLDKILRDPANPSALQAQYNGGDDQHLSPAGYQAVANSIDLDATRAGSCK